MGDSPIESGQSLLQPKKMLRKLHLIVMCLSIVSITFGKLNSSVNMECNGKPEIVSRKEWKARQPNRMSTMSLPVNHVIIIHTVTPTCDTKEKCIRWLWIMQNDHMDYRGFWDIAYQFLIGNDGRVYVGHGWNETGTHTINFNTNSIGIAFMGNFMEAEPTKKALDAAQQLIKCGMDLGYLTPTVEIHGHRDVACTASPGDKLYNIIKTWDNFKGGRLPDYECSDY